MKTKKLRFLLLVPLLALTAQAILLFIAVITMVVAGAAIAALGFRMRNIVLPDITIEHIPPGGTNATIISKLSNAPDYWIIPDAWKVTNGVVELSEDEAIEELEGVHTWTLETTTDMRTWTEFGIPFTGGEAALKEHLEFLSVVDRMTEKTGMRMYRGRHDP